ncbi:hypothetical protein [Inhella sp.]|uniref:hypothetical protein n=1 Tax=Inhella sp. TaxID=1921806 RepID=UPI0035AFF9B4
MKPGNDNALATVGAAQGVEGVSFASNPNSAEAKALAQDKQAATLAARAALAGVTLHLLRDEIGRREWIACRWHLTRAFSSLHDLEAWLDLIGAPR